MGCDIRVVRSCSVYGGSAPSRHGTSAASRRRCPAPPRAQTQKRVLANARGEVYESSDEEAAGEEGAPSDAPAGSARPSRASATTKASPGRPHSKGTDGAAAAGAARKGGSAAGSSAAKKQKIPEFDGA